MKTKNARKLARVAIWSLFAMCLFVIGLAVCCSDGPTKSQDGQGVELKVGELYSITSGLFGQSGASVRVLISDIIVPDTTTGADWIAICVAGDDTLLIRPMGSR